MNEAFVLLVELQYPLDENWQALIPFLILADLSEGPIPTTTINNTALGDKLLTLTIGHVQSGDLFTPGISTCCSGELLTLIIAYVKNGGLFTPCIGIACSYRLFTLSIVIATTCEYILLLKRLILLVHLLYDLNNYE